MQFQVLLGGNEGISKDSSFGKNFNMGNSIELKCNRLTWEKSIGLMCNRVIQDGCLHSWSPEF
jgi:hypothetical protein